MKTNSTWKEQYELEKDGKGLLLITQGDANYHFRLGNWSCGDAKAYGMSVGRYPKDAGGVIALDEVVRLRDFLNEHISQVMPKKSLLARILAVFGR